MAKQRYGEARLILPVPVTLRAETARLDAEEALIKAFGGFTRTTGDGVWREPDYGCVYREAVYIYDVAVPLLSGSGEDANREWSGAMTTLRRIARFAAEAMAQECVYLRSPAGRVHLIKPDGRDFNPDAEPHPFPRA